jgi:uncharacterized protein
MRTISAILLTLAMIPSTYALNLTGINGVKILAVNGKAVASSFFSEDKNELKAGEYQIVVRYSTQLRNESRIESRPSIFTIDLQEDTEISVNRMKSQQQAKKKINAGVTWQIISKNKQYQVSDSDMLKGSGFMPYDDIEGLITQYNEKNNIALIKTAKTAIAAMPSVDTIAATTTDLSKVNMTLESLYQQATKEEKKTFRLWLLEQDMK